MTANDIHNEDDRPETPIETGEDLSGQSPPEDAEDEMERLRQENGKLRDQALRALAEVENVRRRAALDREVITQYANEGLFRDLLPIVDDFRRSVESGEKARDFEPFFQGIQMINDKLGRLLEGRGVTLIPTVGEPFSVEFHEALMRQPSDAPEDTVIGEIEPGYTFGDRVLRHAKVIVSAG